MAAKTKKLSESKKVSEFSQFFSTFPKKEFTPEEEIAAYRAMLLIRRFEEKAGQIYGMGLIGGFCHLYIGQEAVVVGSVKARRAGDQIITSYRDHGHILQVGIDPRAAMAELAGKETGISKGKGGSMHMFAREKEFFGGHGIVGAQVPLGTGLAFANAYRDNNCVTLAYFGDGAANQGQVYESFNMASLWKLPIVYIIENNLYAMGTSVKRATAEEDFSRHGLSFNIPGISVDGMDVSAVYKASQAAIAWASAKNGPIILDMQTYRYRGHSMSDPAKYRTKEEVQRMRTESDPIEQSKKRILKNAWASEEALKDIEKEIRAIVNDAADFAQKSPEPDPQALYSDILL